MSELFSLVHFEFFLIRNNIMFKPVCSHIHGQFTDTNFEMFTFSLKL